MESNISEDKLITLFLDVIDGEMVSLAAIDLHSSDELTETVSVAVVAQKESYLFRITLIFMHGPLFGMGQCMSSDKNYSLRWSRKMNRR